MHPVKLAGFSFLLIFGIQATREIPRSVWQLRSAKVPPAPAFFVDTQKKKCDRSIVVAVIDTGVDYNHPSLAPYVWKNPKEIPDNKIDDDGNGYVDDVVGWNFVHDTPLPYDHHGHGTHISGIIVKNFEPPKGGCPDLKLMLLRYYDNSGFGYNNLNNTVRAIKYAVKNGADVINYSGGGDTPAKVEEDAVREAQEKGVLFVSAAGNDSRDLSKVPYYPANYNLDNIISVASVDYKYNFLASSNFGNVHLAAPGLSILSTLPEGRFGTMSGTSQAVPHVTAAAASMMARYKGSIDSKYLPVRRSSNIRQWLFDGAIPKPGVLYGILNARKSLRIEKEHTPQASRAKPRMEEDGNQ